MNEVVEARQNKQAYVATILESEKSQKKLLDFFNQDSAKVQKFKSSLINIAANPILAQCSANSIIRSAFSLAEIGLDINQNLKQAYILKYSQDAEPVISYKGWQVLLERFGKKTRAFCVFKCDEFNLDYSTFEGELTFNPNYLERNETDREWFLKNLLGVLVRIKDSDNMESFYFVSAKKIEKIKGCSPSVRRGKGSPYDEWFEEMYLAKGIKYVLSKQALCASEAQLAKAVELENEVESKIQADDKKINSFESLLSGDSEVQKMVINESVESVESVDTADTVDIIQI